MNSLNEPGRITGELHLYAYAHERIAVNESKIVQNQSLMNSRYQVIDEGLSASEPLFDGW